MISRRKILSQSRNHVNYSTKYNPYEEEEDIWFHKDKLFSDHIQEVLNKWEQIDDEIWAKIICMERNRRIAKAYAREPILTINGSQDGFDGHKIGLNGFENPMRDSIVEEVKQHIGQGCRIKIDERGNIIVKRYSRCNIYIKGWQSDGCDVSVSKEIVKGNGLLESKKAVKLFDMKKFEQNMEKELRSAYPCREKLENQCISCIAFVKDAANILELPSWMMIINIVALDMLKTKMPKVSNRRQKVPDFVSIFDQSKQWEEDPYSIPANVSYYDYYSNSNGTLLRRTIKEQKPPKLPPRDFGKYKKKKKKNPDVEIPTPDYSQDEDFYSIEPAPTNKATINYRGKTVKDEDPYYCGMEARVPKYAMPHQSPDHTKSVKRRHAHPQMRKVFSSGYINTLMPPLSHKHRSISYYYNSSESDPYATLNDPYEIYEPIYGRIGGINYFSGKSSYLSTMPWNVSREAYLNDW